MIKHKNIKALKCTHSGRSSDFISPSFGFGCLYNCSYCYMKQHKPEGLDVSDNVEDILKSIDEHVDTAVVQKPNQTDPEFITYDISCNEDFALHTKQHKWEEIFEFFKNHNKAKATFATKHIPISFIKYNPNRKVRIRFSLMPQKISTLVEPNTTKILDRIKSVNAFMDAGYDVHLNFSPVIVYKNWLEDYAELFTMVNDYVDYKEDVKAEVIMLTHSERKHEANVENNTQGENLLWVPHLQEAKVNSRGGSRVRYKRARKAKFIKSFENVHNKHIPWNTIRYIF